MLPVETQHPEGPRYAASLVLVPGLWAGMAVWRGFASFLAHRGWESHLLDLRGVRGGLEARARAVAELTGSLAAPPVLVGHDAGALAALSAAGAGPAAAVVLLSPLPPGGRGARRLILDLPTRLRMALGLPVPPPRARVLELLCGELSEQARAAVLGLLGPEDSTAIGELVAPAATVPPAARVPTLLVCGDDDPLCSVAEAQALAAGLGAEQRTLPGAGHWPLAGPGWQPAVGMVHRWLVQRLGEPLLERYAEAMAERDEDETV
jgi:pimeloyl-ACP methyl ester carboxylesterase